MITCQNCGRANSDGSNFCRFCGLKFAHSQNLQPRRKIQPAPPPFKQGQAPRPYSWKTDEFKVKEQPSARKTERIERVRPLADFQNATAPIQTPQQQNQMMRPHGEQRQMMSHGYRCPRCATQLLPQVKKKISSAGWIVFAVMLLAFFPLFWIGFLIKEEVRICPVCNVELRPGTF